MEFRILGPLQVLDEGRELGGAKQRVARAAAARPQPRGLTDRLIDELWHTHRPTPPRRRSRCTSPSCARHSAGDLILTQPPGYLIRVSDGELDLHRFERLVATARAEEPAQAARLLREGLALWRGAPLAELGDSFARAERARLEEQRLAALEQRIEAELAPGATRSWFPSSRGSCASSHCGNVCAAS